MVLTAPSFQSPRQPGILASTSTDTADTTSHGVPQGSSQGPRGTDSAGIFGIKAADAPKLESSAIQKFTFAKPKSEGFGSSRNVSPTKRPSSSVQHHDDSYTKRPITKFNDPFSESEGNISIKLTVGRLEKQNCSWW